MQPIRLTIPGNFWDSHIYRGRLYLWGFDNSVGVYNWMGIIGEIGMSRFPREQLVLECAYTDSALLYDPRAHGMLIDPDIKALLQTKFSKVSKSTIEIEPELLTRHQLARRDNITPELHDDSEIYASRLYLLTNHGLFSTYVHGGGKGAIGIRPKKHWDGSGTYLRAKSMRMAIAALSDGLFQVPLNGPSFNDGTEDEPKQVTNRHVSFVNWSFSSLYCSSERGSFLVGYTWEETRDWLGSHPSRQFAGIIEEDEVFERRGQLSWGLAEKIYSVRTTGIDVVHFKQFALKATPENESVEKPFSRLGELRSQIKLSKPIRTSTATFGVIIETDSALAICQSDNTWTTLPGPVTRWRVFPRSYNYENQLHVVYDDRLEILSFPGDFFVDQRTKLAGIKFESQSRRISRLPFSAA